LHELIQKIWYGKAYLALPLIPLSWIFRAAAALRRECYKRGILRSYSLPVPVIIVGNISVGGTGKTPLLIYLAELLRVAGRRPGIVSRGYGGQSAHWPRRVYRNSDPTDVGDEAILIAERTGCPVAVGPRRADAAQLLLENQECDMILSDDGLQHYALQRTLEIAVIDGERRFGNGYCLPAGPLREPVSRLNSVDLTVCNGRSGNRGEYLMQIHGNIALNLSTGESQPLSYFVGRPCHAFAGIGNPQRFFELLQDAGISCETHIFPDHYAYRRADIDFPDGAPVLMTEKDAVKCRRFRKGNFWYIPAKAELPKTFDEHFLHLLEEQARG
jgi:tetraacyldisaccharide 4'-kinase